MLVGPFNGSLIAHIYGNILTSNWSGLIGQTNIAQLIANVTSVDAASKTITLDRQLPYDYNTNWLNVSVHRWAPSVAVRGSFTGEAGRGKGWEGGRGGRKEGVGGARGERRGGGWVGEG